MLKTIHSATHPGKSVRPHGMTGDAALRGFVADLAGIMNWAANPCADGYGSNGSDERGTARDYYGRVGYPWWNQRG